MPQAKPVTVTWDQKTNSVQCPDEVVVHFDDPNNPDSVLWVMDGGVPEGYAMKIAWDVCSPFGKVSSDIASGGILGTWNNEEPGTYDYTVLVVRLKDRQVVAGFDPKIRNEPPVVED